MADVDDVRQRILQLSPDELHELGDWFWRTLGPPGSAGQGWKEWPVWLSGIERSGDVCGGAARIARTRIPVWALEQMRRLGASESEILRSYPTLRAEDLVHAWAYVDVHAEQIDQEIRENEEA